MIDDEDRLFLAHEWGRQRDATIEGKQMMWLIAEVRRLRAEREHFLEQSGLAHDEKDATITNLRAQLATARAEALREAVTELRRQADGWRRPLIPSEWTERNADAYDEAADVVETLMGVRR